MVTLYCAVSEIQTHRYIIVVNFFYNLNIPPNFLQKGCIDLEIESNNLTANIDFITGTPLSKFFITLIIVDKDNEPTTDIN